MARRVVIIAITLCLLGDTLLAGVVAQCGGSCGACTRRYGCMTPAWGKCCTHFFMQNGKRSVMKKNIQRLFRYAKYKRDMYPLFYKEGTRQMREDLGNGQLLGSFLQEEQA